MKRILFVEDSDLIREMYELILSNERGRWEVRTAADGPAALALLRASAFDVVASDMRMPGMDGIELLKEVARLYPQTARVIISGLGDQGFVADALGSIHQFLVKPVQIDTLKATLVRLTGLDAYLKDEKLKTLAGRIGVLPSFPSLYLEIMQAIESPDASLKSIADLIIKDPGIAAKLLQVVNSTAFGLPERVHDPVAAVQQLGLNTIRSVALSSQVFANFAPSQMNHFSADTLWTHLMNCGQIARVIMRSEGARAAEIEDAFTAGILHDIGKLMLAHSLPREFQEALSLADSRRAPLHEVELEIFGATHAGLAAYLLGLWGLPAPIVEAVAFHHIPERGASAGVSPLAAVHVANALEHELAGEPSHISAAYLAQANLAHRLPAWREEVARLHESPSAP
ncbi:MAG TPA: response regulator [Verrucomicrobiae bacterium]|jgi:HD-like signal output (HDOD) protein|nr:response regulator [Verrucomicrobiae bacterium]